MGVHRKLGHTHLFYQKSYISLLCAEHKYNSIFRFIRIIHIFLLNLNAIHHGFHFRILFITFSLLCQIIYNPLVTPILPFFFVLIIFIIFVRKLSYLKAETKIYIL